MCLHHRRHVPHHRSASVLTVQHLDGAQTNLTISLFFIFWGASSAFVWIVTAREIDRKFRGERGNNMQQRTQTRIQHGAVRQGLQP